MALRIDNGKTHKYINKTDVEPNDSMEFVLKFNTPNDREVQGKRGPFTSHSFLIEVTKMNGAVIAPTECYWSILDNNKSSLFGTSVLDLLKAQPVGAKLSATYKVKKTKTGTMFGVWEFGGNVIPPKASASQQTSSQEPNPEPPVDSMEDVIAELVTRSKKDKRIATELEVKQFLKLSKNVEDDEILKHVVAQYNARMWQ